MSSSAPVLRTAPLALWRVAEAFLTTLYQVFGNPEHVAARHTLSAKSHRLFATWLRAAEALMRRLLLIEAAAYPKPNTRPLLYPRRARARKRRCFTADKPEDWCVSFRCLMERRRPRRQVSINPHQSRRPDAGAPYFHSAWPLAERYEALLRAFANPAPYARRLAARLHATPHRARALIAYPPDTPGLIGRDSFASTDPPAAQAVHHFSSA